MKLLISFNVDDKILSSCSNCGLDFYIKSPESPAYLMFCSHVCKFRYVYRNLAFMPEKYLVELWAHAFNLEPIGFERQKALFDLTKFCIGKNLYSICYSSRLSSNNLGSEKLTAHAPFLERACMSQHELEPITKEDITLWF